MTGQDGAPGPLRHNPANPRYFADPEGRAIYLTGSHTWAVHNDMWLDGQARRSMDYEGFLAMMAESGHNFMRYWQWMHPRRAAWSTVPTLFDPQPFARTGPGLAADGLHRFDLATFNEAYFARLRERLQAAGRLGIYAAVMLFEAWTVKRGEGPTNPWPEHPMHPDNNINGITDNPVTAGGRAENLFSLHCPQLLAWQKRYVAKVVEAVNDLDNVLFEVCNEVPHRPEAMAWSDEICAFVHSTEAALPKAHPVGITSEGGDQNNDELYATSADWISPSNGRLFEYRYNPPPADGRKVVVTDTDHLWGHGCEIPWIWKSFLRGHNVLFMDPWEPIPADMPGWQRGGVSLNRRDYPLWPTVRANLGHTRRLAQGLDLNAARPAPELCTSTYCLAVPGRAYVCYLPAGGSEGLDLHDAPGTFAASWLRPRTGETIGGRDLRGGRRHVLTSPWPGDAVLELHRRD